MNNLETYLIELRLLTEKYGYIIDGCGCCASPWLTSANKDNHETYSLSFVEGKYVVEEI